MMGRASRTGARPPPKTAVRRSLLLLGVCALLLGYAIGRPGGAGVPAEREQSAGASTAAGCAGTAGARLQARAPRLASAGHALSLRSKSACGHRDNCRPDGPSSHSEFRGVKRRGPGCSEAGACGARVLAFCTRCAALVLAFAHTRGLRAALCVYANPLGTLIMQVRRALRACHACAC